MKNNIKFIILLSLIVLANNNFSRGLGLDTSSFYKKEKKEKKMIDDGTGAAQKGNMMIQASLNIGHHLGFKKNYSSYGFDYAYNGLIPGATLNLDYNVHRYVGVGLYYSVGFQTYKVSNIFYLGHAFGARTTFHWWQMLDDKSDKDLFSDKIDLDLHLHIGGFLLSEKNKIDNTKIKNFGVNAGVGLGFKYYFVKNFGVAMDFGYEETSFAKLGIVVKF